MKIWRSSRQKLFIIQNNIFLSLRYRLVYFIWLICSATERTNMEQNYINYEIENVGKPQSTIHSVHDLQNCFCLRMLGSVFLFIPLSAGTFTDFLLHDIMIYLIKSSDYYYIIWSVLHLSYKHTFSGIYRDYKRIGNP